MFLSKFAGNALNVKQVAGVGRYHLHELIKFHFIADIFYRVDIALYIRVDVIVIKIAPHNAGVCMEFREAAPVDDLP